MSSDQLNLYFEMEVMGNTYYNSNTYKGTHLDEILEYSNIYSEIGNDLKQYLKDKYAEEKDENVVKNGMTSYKETINQKVKAYDELTTNDFKNGKAFADTKDNVDKEVFGAKLCKGKEVIATYVGAMSSRINDSAGMFNTGYYTTFETSVVYKENDQIIIKKDKIYVPYYNNSTNESLYNTFLSDTDGTKHNIESISTEVVNNPVIATENGKKAEYNISFESDDPQLASIASSAISQWLKNEEDSLSR